MCDKDCGGLRGMTDKTGKAILADLDKLVKWGYVAYFRDYYTPTDGQTVFTSTNTPDLNFIDFSVGGLEQQLGVDYTINGNTITWISPDFQLNSYKKIIFQYTYK